MLGKKSQMSDFYPFSQKMDYEHTYFVTSISHFMDLNRNWRYSLFLSKLLIGNSLLWNQRERESFMYCRLVKELAKKWSEWNKEMKKWDKSTINFFYSVSFCLLVLWVGSSSLNTDERKTPTSNYFHQNDVI